jgi:peptidoglycan/LPS O-acetylase OafA/YrhL
VEHWLYLSLLNRALPTGFMGVRLFFVLSGFLITAILLKADSSEGVGQPLMNFYARRFLRIFPIYYLTLAVCYAADIGAVRELFPWHVTYTSNIFYFLNQRLKGLEAPFWSLSVEEQFYVVWPLVILLAPRTRVRAIMLTFVAVGVGSRLLLLAMGYTYILPFPLACFDSFAIGGLLAGAAARGRDSIARVLSGNQRLWAVNSVALVALFLFPIPYDRRHWIYEAFLSLHWSIFFAWLVGWASLGFKGLGKRVLENPAVLYVGKISYGFYIFHTFVGAAVDRVWPGHESSLLLYPVKYGATILVAALSWHLIEAPISSLKERFRYGVARA